jgi:hypothetical protein
VIPAYIFQLVNGLRERNYELSFLNTLTNSLKTKEENKQIWL